MSLTLPSVADVRVIITTTLDDDGVQAAIDDAALLVEGCISSLDAERQATIVKYTAAHLISSFANSSSAGASLSSKKLGDASETYVRPALGEGLSGSIYGKRAMDFDTTGCLRQLGGNAVFMKVL